MGLVLVPVGEMWRQTHSTKPNPRIIRPRRQWPYAGDPRYRRLWDFIVDENYSPNIPVRLGLANLFFDTVDVPKLKNSKAYSVPAVRDAVDWMQGGPDLFIFVGGIDIDEVGPGNLDSSQINWQPN